MKCGAIGTHVPNERKYCTATLENSLAASYKFKHILHLRFDPAITLLENLGSHENLYVFIVASFIIVKNWKQHKCPSTGE